MVELAYFVADDTPKRPQKRLGTTLRSLRDWESPMNNTDPNLQPPAFTRKSPKESICMFCFLTIQSDRYTPIEEVEDIHADVCLVKPGSPVRYVLL